MRFNLIEERWIPVLREDGGREVIAPWELTRGDPPLVELFPPRPDFGAAIMEWLIGLLQTAFAPAKAKDWRKQLAAPPAPDTLRAALSPHAPYFNLFGDKPLFMQDMELEHPEKDKDYNDIAALLIDSPGGQTLRFNTDFFIKRGGVPALCPACAAMALTTMQGFSPAGGAGIRTSLRGGGPLSTLADGPTLWDKVWRNVLPLSSTYARNIAPPTAADLPGKVYPWAAPTRQSLKGEETHPADVHALQAYWGMPRRILLRPEQAAAGEACALCAAMPQTIVRRFHSRPRGTNYGDTWRHPLSPYREQGPGKPTLAVKGSSSVTGYGHWLGVVYGQGAATGIRRAACVDSALSLLDDGFSPEPPSLDITVAGYDMDNAKPRQWCEARFPYYPVKDESLPQFRYVVDKLVLAADAVRKNLAGLLKEALVNEAGRNQAKIDKTIFDNTANAFWGRTETDFYRMAQALAHAPDMNANEPLRAEWSTILINTARALFEETTERGRIKPERMQRIVEAGRKLDNFNRKKLETVLELPKTGGKK